MGMLVIKEERKNDRVFLEKRHSSWISSSWTRSKGCGDDRKWRWRLIGRKSKSAEQDRRPLQRGDALVRSSTPGDAAGSTLFGPRRAGRQGCSLYATPVRASTPAGRGLQKFQQPQGVARSDWDWTPGIIGQGDISMALQVLACTYAPHLKFEPDWRRLETGGVRRRWWDWALETAWGRSLGKREATGERIISCLPLVTGLLPRTEFKSYGPT
jgi:hypothetical protein